MHNQATTDATPASSSPARASRSVQITSEERVRQGRADSQPKGNAWSEWFARAATRVSEALGSAIAFVLALLVIIVWAITGPIFGFSDTWQLVINTGTTIITFLMVFVIQNTQNRDAKATQVKLDELIRAVGDARNEFIGLEDQDEAELDREKQDVEAERDDVEKEHEQVEEEHAEVEAEHEQVEEEHEDAEAGRENGPKAGREKGRKADEKGRKAGEKSAKGGKGAKGKRGARTSHNGVGSRSG